MSADATIEIAKPVQLDRLIAVSADLDLPGRVELLRAVRRGQINLAEPPRDRTVPLKVLQGSLRPLVVVLGDDDYQSTGPNGWAALQRLLRWAKGAMIHAAGGDAPSYRMAIGMALQCRRFLLIETDTAHAQTWGEVLLARGIPFVVLVPRDGGVHPVEREILQ